MDGSHDLANFDLIPHGETNWHLEGTTTFLWEIKWQLEVTLFCFDMKHPVVLMNFIRPQ